MRNIELIISHVFFFPSFLYLFQHIERGIEECGRGKKEKEKKRKSNEEESKGGT